jgi:hypothetical protein
MASWDRKDFDSYCKAHGESPHDDFHEKFWTTLVEYEALLQGKHAGKRVRATRTWLSIRDKGAIRTTAEHVLRAKPTQGFMDLIGLGKPENTDEYSLLLFRKQIPFCARAVQNAKARLKVFNVPLPTPLPQNR